MGREVKNFSLSIIASGLDVNAADSFERLFEAGCDDATISVQKGLFVIDFDRDANSFKEALVSAIHDVKRAGARIDRIEPDYLVNASDIASRMGATRAAVSLYASGKRGRCFPAPVARVTTDSPLWDWVEVSEWLVQEKKLSQEAVEEAHLIREMNRVIARSHMQLSEADRKLEAELARL
jgi:predicted transcriptional regulator